MKLNSFLFIVNACILYVSCYKKKATIKEFTSVTYPELYREHVYYTLSDAAKEIFVAPNSHPSCSEKKGTCMPRAQCVGREMLYISRVCYRRDQVCCYSNTIDFPEVAPKDYVPPTPRNISYEAYEEPQPLP